MSIVATNNPTSTEILQAFAKFGGTPDLDVLYQDFAREGTNSRNWLNTWSDQQAAKLSGVQAYTGLPANAISMMGAPPTATASAATWTDWLTGQAQKAGGGLVDKIVSGFGAGPLINTAIGVGVGELIPRIPGMLTPSNGTKTSGCGCGGHSRCSSSGPAPLATFFGGECPPGRVLRRKPMGRDVCIKKPRMNVLNDCALRRANRRVTGFARISSKILKRMGYSVSVKRPLAKLGKRGRKR